MIDNLPVELLSVVIDCLPQTDCYHLLLTNKSLSSIVRKKLYRAIIIDSSTNYYHKELLDFNDLSLIKYSYNDKIVCKYYKSTVIRTNHGLKLFFKTLFKNPSLIGFVEYLEIYKKLPDHLLEFELLKYFKKLFPLLINLKSLNFHYNSCFINLLELINYLPKNNDRLIAINGDFSVNQRQKKSLQNNLSIKNLNDNFKNLNKISIENFLSSSNALNGVLLPLKKNLKFLEISKNNRIVFPNNYQVINAIDIDFNYLQDRFNKYFNNDMTNDLSQNDFSLIFRNSSNRNNITISTTETSEENNIIKNLFKDNITVNRKLKLLEIRLDSFVLTSSDSKILSNAVYLENLQKLTLLNITELVDSDRHRHYNNEKFFLTDLAPYLSNVEELNIDFYNELRDCIPELISSISNLRKLYVDIRWDASRERVHNISWDGLCSIYFESILKHKNTMTNLLIDTKNEAQNHQNNNNLVMFQEGEQQQQRDETHLGKSNDYYIKPLNIIILADYLINLKNLHNLRLPLSIVNLSFFINECLENFKNLEFLEIIFSEFNTSANYETNGANDGIASNYNRHLGTLLVSPSQSTYASLNSSLSSLNSLTVEDQGNDFKLEEFNLNIGTITEIAQKIKQNCQSLRYLKIFNVITELRSVDDIKVKERGLDDWFNYKLRGNVW
ncbi:hypothetical protein PACTADRAFT_35524 [Pachysolen tannophilus NRRL Y-2460]|uniref:F-box domain-containing protein n=1 Tax=Pachysolen tannophilus NRRL Y-2460 TaxID=669874 RepID=A0A1E4TPX7_PACTA|nr:hypothetical protein PACTADRAFT_35524 [Pachysolen tannophilus NRRL Y-2460]